MWRGSLLVVALLFALVTAGLAVRELNYLLRWPEVEATVLGGRVLEEASGGDDSHPLYRSEIQVEYPLDGHPQRGRAVSTYWSTDRAEVQSVLDRFAPAARHQMRRNPSTPEELRFDTELTFSTFKWPAITAGFSALFLVAWFLLRRFD